MSIATIMSIANIMRTAILLLWIISMGVLLRFEAYPEWFTHTLPGYKGLIADSLLTRETWSRILINGVPAGYSHSTIDIIDEKAEESLEINNRIHLRLELFGKPFVIFAQTLVTLDRDFGLVSFNTSCSAGDFSMRADGHRRENRLFDITLNAAGTETTHTIEIPSETFLYSPVQELALRHLRPGGRLSLKTINPLTLQTSTVQVEALKRETIHIGGNTTEAIRLRSSWQGMTFDSWIDAEGLVLRQETPQGWIIEACSPSEALAAVSGGTPPPAPFAFTGGGGFLLNLLTGKAGTNP